ITWSKKETGALLHLRFSAQPHVGINSLSEHVELYGICSSLALHHWIFRNFVHDCCRSVIGSH
ncbi:hypothetical protein Droror1_Dr00010095, partial [Drosera rotundifolia]